MFLEVAKKREKHLKSSPFSFFLIIYVFLGMAKSGGSI